MSNACSLGLSRAIIGDSNIIKRGPMAPRRRRSQTALGPWWPVTIAACAILTSGEVAAQTAEQIELGRKLFFEETFGGNGRTCGTCHPANNNFTIDPAFVRSLPGKDPLFIVKTTKELKDLEIKQFLRQGTILENLDTFGNAGVMRGVPHTLALGTSTAGGGLGWSGDGSPGNSLRSFATGAVTQHFPKTLARRSCTFENFDPNLCDFRLPTPEELDAMAAFQLSLGRQGDPPPIAALEFDDDTVDLGRELFIESPSRGGTNSCDGCHTNGGTINIALDTGVAKLPNVPACQLAVGKGVPGDGGFGPLPVTTMTHQQLCKKGTKKTAIVFRGDGKFDIPPVIEAADTPPLFHNNSAATIEDAVAFYTSDTFHSSPSGSGAFGGGAFVLSKDQINQIAAFLRALNALENIRSSNAYDRRAINPAELAPRKLLVELAIAETSDAIEVLTKGPVRLFASTLAVQLLQEARKLERQALKQNPPNTDLLDLAIARKGEARAEMLEDPAP